MKFHLPQFITNIKINFQRWQFRRTSKNHAERQLRTISKADRLTKKHGNRLWVVTFDRGKFLLFTKPEMKAAMKRIPESLRINMYQTNDYIVHITKKGNESR